MGVSGRGDEAHTAVQSQFWRGRRVFVTGHTGFKGGWLSTWLHDMGAVVRGFALPPNTEPNLFSAVQLDQLVDSTFGDIRDADALSRSLSAFEPEIVLHLAAQPLVRLSYQTPLETFATNVMGTAHLFEAVRSCNTVRVVLNVTTDKVYENLETPRGYCESDPLGGHDPYSTSKACSELVTASYRKSFLSRNDVGVATARAGNVLGGGDWSSDRLIPDAIRSWVEGKPVLVRNPNSVRPWQHVLDPLAGYLLLVERCWTDPQKYSCAWNFGPDPKDVITVGNLLGRLSTAWGAGAHWEEAIVDDNAPHEAGLLLLDIAKAQADLNWHPRVGLDTCLQWTAEWYQAQAKGASASQLRAIMMQQVAAGGLTE